MYEIGGVGTEIIFEQFNPHSFKAYPQGARKLGNVAFMNQGRGDLKNYIKLPGGREFKRADLLRFPLAFEKIKILKIGVDRISRMLARKMRTV